MDCKDKTKRKDKKRNADAKESMDRMEHDYVPELRYGGRVRFIEGDEEDIHKDHENENDRERVKKNKGMLDMGESHLFMPPQVQTPYSDNQSHSTRTIQSRKFIYHEDQYQHTNLPHHELLQREQFRKNNRDREQSREASILESVPDDYFLVEENKTGRHTSVNLKDHYVLTGSEVRDVTKLTLTSEESEQVMEDLKEAQETNMFKVWPTYQDGVVPDERPKKKTTVSMEESVIFVPHRRVSTRRKASMEESGILAPIRQGSEMQRRDDMIKQWRAKGERDIAGRLRTPGGYEDVLESNVLKSLDSFEKPSLMDMDVEKYQRGQDTNEEDDGEEWERYRRMGTARRIAAWGDGFKQQKGRNEDGVWKERSARKDQRAKQDARVRDSNASDSSNGSSTKSRSYAEQKERPMTKDTARNFARGTDDTRTKYSSRNGNSSQDDVATATKLQADRKQLKGDDPTSKGDVRRFSFAASYDSRRGSKSQKNVTTKLNLEEKEGDSNSPAVKDGNRGSSAQQDSRPGYFSRGRMSTQDGAARSKSQAEQEQTQRRSDKPTAQILGSGHSFGSRSGKDSEKDITTRLDSKHKEGSSHTLRFGDDPESDESIENARPKYGPRSKRVQEAMAAKAKSQTEQEQDQESSDTPKSVRRPTYTSSFAHRNRQNKAGPPEVSKP